MRKNKLQVLLQRARASKFLPFKKFPRKPKIEFYCSSGIRLDILREAGFLNWR